MKKGSSKSTEPLLDLHGFKTEAVADAVDRFIVTSTRQGAARVRIITGKGSGAVKRAVIEYLKLGGFPFTSERTPAGSSNEGALVVFLD